ncbi:hypothetical protein D3C76_1423990 [compost metagenome]
MFVISEVVIHHERHRNLPPQLGQLCGEGVAFGLQFLDCLDELASTALLLFAWNAQRFAYGCDVQRHGNGNVAVAGQLLLRHRLRGWLRGQGGAGCIAN